MADPLLFRSHDGVSDAGAGASTLTKGHDVITLYVKVGSTVADPTTLDFACTLEGAPDDRHFSPINYRGPTDNDVFEVSAAQLVGSDDASDLFVAQVSSNSIATNYVRANVTAAGTDVDSVTSIIQLNGWGGPGRRFQDKRDVGIEPEYNTV